MLRGLLLISAFVLSLPVYAGNSIEDNKKLVVDFYKDVIFHGKSETLDKYIGDKYIQHNPTVADGKEGLRNLLKHIPRSDEPSGEIVRVIAEGDLVVLHVKSYHWPAPNGGAIMDIFRVEKGKIVEHWDVIQGIPSSSANDNTMF